MASLLLQHDVEVRKENVLLSLTKVIQSAEIHIGSARGTSPKQQSHSSHTLAYNPYARRAYEKSQHAEDFGRKK